MLEALLGCLLMTIPLHSSAPGEGPGVFLPRTTPVEHSMLPRTRVDADGSVFLPRAGQPAIAELLGKRDARLASELLTARPDHARELLPVTSSKPSRTSLLLD